MKKIFTFGVVALLLVGVLAGCTDSQNINSQTKKVSVTDNKDMAIVEGTVKNVEQGIDGISVTLDSNNKNYTTTISIVTTEILGDLEKMQKGTKIRVAGELWDNEQFNMLAKSVEILDSQIDYVINLRATVNSIELGKDGITAKIITEDNKDFSATISMVSTDIPVGEFKDIKEGTKLWISGQVIELKEASVIASNIVLVNPQIIDLKGAFL